jgi:hypothetical protein
MRITAYCIESRKHGAIGLESSPGVPIGMVQFLAQTDPEEGLERAVELLKDHSPLAQHETLGFATWRAKLVTVDEGNLGKPVVEDLAQGYRLWLLAAVA